jgi:putative FmdB family regulatory protein
MPIFDYRCTECGHIFDALQKLGADPLVDCPECGEAALKKMLSAPAFHLKGKGWRNSDDAPKKPDVRPKFAHTLDSAVPHAEHTHDGPSKSATEKVHGHSHDHGGGVGKIVRDHMHAKEHSHGHSHDHAHGHSHGHGSGDGHGKDKGKEKGKSKAKDHSHGNSHGHSHGHSHKHD